MSSGSVEVISTPLSITIDSGFSAASAVVSSSAALLIAGSNLSAATASINTASVNTLLYSPAASITTASIGNASVSGNFVAQTASFSTLKVSGNASISGNASVSGDFIVATNASVIGNIYATTASITTASITNASVGGNLHTVNASATTRLYAATASITTASMQNASVTNNLYVGGTLDIQGDIELDHLHYGGATGSYVKVWGASVAISLGATGSGAVSLSLPSFITNDNVSGKKIHATVTQIDATFPRCIFSVGRGADPATTLEIKGLDIFYNAGIIGTALTGASAAVTVIAVYPAP